MLTAYVISPDERKRALKCAECGLTYSVKDYDLLYSNQKLIYFKFKSPNSKRSKIYCHECILKAMAASEPAKEELKINPSSRSAKLRYAIKVNNSSDFIDFLKKFEHLLNIEKLSNHL